VRGGLLYFCLRRLAIGIPFLVVIVAITFLLVHMAPGDPAIILAGDAPAPEFLARIRAEYGLDLPLHEQLFTYIVRALHFDFGTSIYFRRPVLEVVAERIPNTLLLTGAAMLLASVTGILLGVWAARFRGTAVDSAVSGLSLLGFSIPTFWLGQLLVLLFAVTLNLLPTGGMIASRARFTGFDHIVDVAQHLILPAVTLAAFELCMIARFTRTAMIQALDRDFILVAEAKGASALRVLWRHAFPNAVLTSITIIGLEFGTLLAGAVVTETIYGWPGLGRLFYEAVFRRDFPLLNGCFIFAAAAVIVVNLATDVVYALIDPRIYRT
jgi:peptide/nickel transport system permease protein